MTRIVTLALLLGCGASVAAAQTPLKISVRELLAHPDKYDKRRVDVSGYYTAGMEDSFLWPDSRTSKLGKPFEASMYIDPVTWDPTKHPKRSPDILDAWSGHRRRTRVIGTFRSHPIPPGVVTNASHGPTITDVSYFRPVR
jgi:hypothetical protein